MNIKTPVSINLIWWHECYDVELLEKIKMSKFSVKSVVSVVVATVIAFTSFAGISFNELISKSIKSFCVFAFSGKVNKKEEIIKKTKNLTRIKTKYSG